MWSGPSIAIPASPIAFLPRASSATPGRWAGPADTSLPEPTANLLRLWEDTVGVRGSASYYLLDQDLEVFAGGSWDGNAVPDSTLEPAFIDMSKFTLEAGGRYVIADHVGLMLTFTNVFYSDRTVEGESYQQFLNRSRQPSSAGTYEQNIFIIATNLELMF